MNTILIPFNEIYEEPEFSIAFSEDSLYISSSPICSDDPTEFIRSVLEYNNNTYPSHCYLVPYYSEITITNGQKTSCIVNSSVSVENMLMIVWNKMKEERTIHPIPEFRHVDKNVLADHTRLRLADVRQYESKLCQCINELGLNRRDETKRGRTWKMLRYYYYKIKGALILGWMEYRYLSIHNIEIERYLCDDEAE